MKLTGSKGTIDAVIGDVFEDRLYGGNWRIERFDTSVTHYSPAALGGTCTVYCKPLDPLPEYWRKWVEPDGTVGWCGDSVASCLIAGRAALNAKESET